MFHTFAIILGIIAICMLLLSVRLFFGKGFVHTHIEGNKEMQKRGIHCVTHMDRMERRQRRTMVEENSREKKK